MFTIWQQTFVPTYIRADGIINLNDVDIPLPKGFAPDPKLRSNVIFPPGTRAGDHYHTKREELFVGFGHGMQLLIEDPDTKEAEVYPMDPAKNDDQCIAFLVRKNTPHAIINKADTPGFLIELATHPPEKIDYRVSID